jgi:peptidyl-prolyl cis-trans isomerase C
MQCIPFKDGSRKEIIMSSRDRAFVLLVGAVSMAAFAGCEQLQQSLQPSSSRKPSAAATSSAPASTGTVLARVNNEVITLESFDEKMKNRNAVVTEPAQRVETTEAKKQFLDELITDELVLQEARGRGIDKKKEVKDAIEAYHKFVMAQQLVEDETKGISVEPAEIQAFYDRSKNAFVTPAEARVREIVVANEAAAKDVMMALLGGADFAAVAREKSKASNAAEGGDLGFYDRTDKTVAFDKLNSVVDTLEPGQFSQYFSGPDGYYIIKVDEKKGGAILQITDKVPGSEATIYDAIKERLLAEKRLQRLKDLTDRLKREAKIDIKQDLIR